MRQNWNVVIAIVDDAGLLTHLERLDGAQPASSDIAQHKAKRQPSSSAPQKPYEEVVANGRVALLSLPHLTPVEGGLPLVYKGQVVGALSFQAYNLLKMRKSPLPEQLPQTTPADLV